jgi:hypothetical protein
VVEADHRVVAFPLKVGTQSAHEGGTESVVRVTFGGDELQLEAGGHLALPAPGVDVDLVPPLIAALGDAEKISFQAAVGKILK